MGCALATAFERWLLYLVSTVPVVAPAKFPLEVTDSVLIWLTNAGLCVYKQEVQGPRQASMLDQQLVSSADETTEQYYIQGTDRLAGATKCIISDC